ncbi:MAG: hypothetical protein ACYTXC_05700 [Nostoc sp.]
MFWQELRDALAKQTGWKINPLGSGLIPPCELKIIWEDSQKNTRDGYMLILSYVRFKTNEETQNIHTITITRHDRNLSTLIARKFKIEEISQNDIDMLVATIKKEIPFKKADPIPTLIT